MKEKWEEANGKSQKCIDLDTPVGQLLDMSYPPSNEGKRIVLSSLNRICKRRNLNPNAGKRNQHINTRQTARGTTPGEDEQYHCPVNCKT